MVHTPDNHYREVLPEGDQSEQENVTAMCLMAQRIYKQLKENLPLEGNEIDGSAIYPLSIESHTIERAMLASSSKAFANLRVKNIGNNIYNLKATILSAHLPGNLELDIDPNSFELAAQRLLGTNATKLDQSKVIDRITQTVLRVYDFPDEGNTQYDYFKNLWYVTTNMDVEREISSPDALNSLNFPDVVSMSDMRSVLRNIEGLLGKVLSERK